MRPRLNKLAAFLFGQNFPHVVQHVVSEDPNQVGYELKYGAHGMSESAQKAYLDWVASLPEAERV